MTAGHSGKPSQSSIETRQQHLINNFLLNFAKNPSTGQAVHWPKLRLRPTLTCRVSAEEVLANSEVGSACQDCILE